MSDFDQELKLAFLEEAAQTIVELEQCLLSLEVDPNDEDNLNKIFRQAHNLKGSSKAVGFDEVGAFTHEYESFILKIKNKELEALPKVVNLLLRCCDQLNQMISGLKENLEAKFDCEGLLSEMKNGNFSAEESPSSDAQTSSQMEDSTGLDASDFFTPDTSLPPAPKAESPNTIELESLQNPTPIASTTPLVPATNSEIEPNFDLLKELGMSPEDIATMTQASPPAPAKNPEPSPNANITAAPTIADLSLLIAETSPKNTNVNIAKPESNLKPAPEPEKPNKPTASSPPSTKAAAAVDDSIRVSISKVENLLNYVGEMVILQSVLKEQVNQSTSLLMKRTTDQMEKISKEIQSLSMSLRMVPVKQTFQKMQRIVRDTAQSLKKDVGISIRGEETEIDKTVLERINDPLVHLIRNSVDHGIESVELRRQRNKPDKGQVILAAYHQSGKLVIDVRDDGGGLDPEKLTKLAISKGILKPGTVLSKQEAQALIFAPGFSTKEQVTDVSGRGVGMDVVKTNIRDLSGEIVIESEVGTGTCFKIILPLTLAIIDGMVITYTDEKFIVPLGHVHETLRPTSDQVQYSTGIGNVLLLRGENLPLYNLGDFFGLKSKNKISDMIAMVIRTGGQPFAILVDDIIGQFQVVVKQLGNELENYKGVSGSTILGDGKPALILEPQDLFKRKQISRSTSQGVAA